MSRGIDARGGRVLGICLPNWSFGEATLGIHLLKRSVYRAVKFIVSPIQAPLFRFHGIDHVCLTPTKQKLNELLILTTIEQFEPDELLIVDPLTFCESGMYFGITPEFLVGRGLPITGVDVYGASGDFSGRSLPHGAVFMRYHELLRDLARVYRPCPIYDARMLKVDDGPPAECYSILPELQLDQERPPLEANTPLRVVMTNAAWEDKLPYNTERTKVIRDFVRSYVFGVLGEIAKHRPVAVDLVGVTNLAKYAESDGLSLTFHATVTPDRLKQMLSEAALYATSNIIASTISVSLSVGTPVVCFRNSTPLVPRGGVAINGSDLSAFVLPPFLVCPIGWFDFLNSMLAQSRFSDCVEFVELSTPAEAAASRVLEHVNRGETRGSQRQYLEETQALPKIVLGRSYRPIEKETVKSASSG